MDISEKLYAKLEITIYDDIEMGEARTTAKKLGYNPRVYSETYELNELGEPVSKTLYWSKEISKLK